MLNEEGSSATDFVTDLTDVTHILHHSQEFVGAGSPIALKAGNSLNKPAPTHEKAPY
ncbi:MAG: hypothetical protein U7126_11480 [Microcoleus sp.]